MQAYETSLIYIVTLWETKKEHESPAIRNSKRTTEGRETKERKKWNNTRGGDWINNRENFCGQCTNVCYWRFEKTLFVDNLGIAHKRQIMLFFFVVMIYFLYLFYLPRVTWWPFLFPYVKYDKRNPITMERVKCRVRFKVAFPAGHSFLPTLRFTS